ncbi:helix-turn-helix domain-containing protein [Streptomyces sp. NPDC055632]
MIRVGGSPLAGHEPSGSEDSAVVGDRCPAGFNGGPVTSSRDGSGSGPAVADCTEVRRGGSILEVSRRLRIASDTVRTWRRHFVERGLDGLGDGPGPDAPRKITDAGVERVIVKPLEETPKNATRWSTRSMVAATGMSRARGRRARHRPVLR